MNEVFPCSRPFERYAMFLAIDNDIFVRLSIGMWGLDLALLDQ